jgi:hypothetical protein
VKKGLRALLVVPTYASRDNNRISYDGAKLRALVSAHRPDLVVFPESFDSVSAEAASLAAIRRASVKWVSNFAEQLGVPLLVGLWAQKVHGERGLQCAAYSNPAPARNESRSHFYAKHSTSQVLPYELPDYAAERDMMFKPIVLGGRRIGVQLCHDQFFGLVSEKLVRSGADVLIDLTGDSVVASKWRNVMAGRSLEHGLPFFCTMTRNLSAKKNRAFATAFREGREVTPETAITSERRGDFVLIDSEGPTEPGEIEQGLSATAASVLTLALCPSRPAAKPGLFVDGDGVAGIAPGKWRDVGDVGVLVLGAATLRDPLCIHRHESAPRRTSKNVVCFVSRTDDLTGDDAVILGRLRALEHRVAIVICTPSVREVIKTSRYKNIQRIAEREGLFGLDGAFMKGTYASMAATWPNGIPEAHQQAYRGLLD